MAVNSNGQRRLKQFVLHTPKVWWYDHDSGTTHEHGTVGWQYRIQMSSDLASVPFQTIFTSKIQKRTAYEDHPGYSDGDKAPFSARTLSWETGNPEWYRVKYTIIWYRSDGTVKGTLSHWYGQYDSNDTAYPIFGYCDNKYTPV